jgi:outer membrane protein TolC
MQSRLFLLSCSLVCTLLLRGQSQASFSQLGDILDYADRNSKTLQQSPIRQEQAQKARLASLLGIADLTGEGYFSHTNNLRLPVNLFPAEIFGGTPGSFEKIEVGIQYVSTFGLTADLKLFNPVGWQNLKLAKLNTELVAISNNLERKDLYQQIATTYFNIVNLKEQEKSIRQNLEAADTLYRITKNKYAQGIAKQQDVSLTQVSFLETEERLRQCNYLMKQQYIALKILTDTPQEDSVSINDPVEVSSPQLTGKADDNDLMLRQERVQESMAHQRYRASVADLLPTISLFGGAFSNQYNTQSKWFDRGVQWIPNNYVGLRMALRIPTSAQIGRLYQNRYDVQLSTKSREQAAIKVKLETEKLDTDFQKALSQFQSYKNILQLRKDSYEKNLLAYQEGIIPLDETIQSFNDMVNANYSMISAGVNLLLAQAKININNRIK